MNILFKPISQLLTLKPHTVKALERLNLYLARDLLLHKPHNYIARTINPDLSSLRHGDHIITEVTIRDVQQPKKRGAPLKIYADNETGSILLIFFNKLHPFVFSQLRVGMKRIIEGKVELNDFYYQISHPDLIMDRKQVEGIEPVYPLTHGINNKQMHTYVLKALEGMEVLTSVRESHNEIHNKLDFGSKDLSSQLLKAFKGIHRPKSLNDIDIHIKTLARLELLANQLTLANIRKQNHKQRGRAFSKATEFQDNIIAKLNFTLSAGQESVIAEIEEDQAAETRMTRMLQGDVGSGKTLVALMTMLNVTAQSVQSALMAPTDLLATQHYAFFSKALGNDKVALLTGKTKAAERKDIMAKLESGEILILIGTHALFQNNVTFSNLGYIVIDEQHRFGVQQRLELLAKANNPDLLLMTATPIPRSLTLTLFGDMSVSRLMTKPQNRPEIKTIASPKSKTDDIINSLERKLQAGEKIYWICPLIEQDEEKKAQELTDVISRFNIINEHYPNKAALLHGKLSSDNKDEIMMRFKNSDLMILVSTTVIEVGIDVPDATLIVIENAERFGLAQLHQLRGRVGRGALPSHCVLLYSHLGGMIKQRIETMRTSNDGFYIAEEDLKLRGGGEILGVKQSGQEDFHFADLANDIDILIACKKEAETMQLNEDAELLMKIFDNGLGESGLGG